MISKTLMPPSFYMWSSWLFVFVLYLLEPIALNPLRPEFLFVVVYVITIALASNLIFREVYFKRNAQLRIKATPVAPMAFVTCTIIGFYGIYSYLVYASGLFGGMAALLATAVVNPLEIRAISIDELGGAVQLSYFSWISIGFGIFLFRQPQYGYFAKFVIITIVLLTFFSNMFFIDRTRPIWLMIIVLISFIALSKDPRKWMLRFVFMTPLFIFALFIVFSIATGKLTEGGISETLLQYILGGFSYSNFLLGELQGFDYLPIRTFYPIAKVFEVTGLGVPVPSQVLDFYEVPFATNIGGFVEPLIGDGGLIYVLIGVPMIVFVSDWLGLVALKSRTYFGVFLYANLIFSNMFSFFVAKFCSSPIYLFVLIFMISRLMFHLSRRKTFQPVPIGIRHQPR